MLSILFWSAVGLSAGVGLRILLECIFDGGIAFGDTPIHRAYKNEAEKRHGNCLKMAREARKKSFRNGGIPITNRNAAA